MQIPFIMITLLLIRAVIITRELSLCHHFTDVIIVFKLSHHQHRLIVSAAYRWNFISLDLYNYLKVPYYSHGDINGISCWGSERHKIYLSDKTHYGLLNRTGA